MSGKIVERGRGFKKFKEACTKYDGLFLEYNISVFGIMVLRVACDKYLKLLNDKNDYQIDQSYQNVKKEFLRK